MGKVKTTEAATDDNRLIAFVAQPVPINNSSALILSPFSDVPGYPLADAQRFRSHATQEVRSVSASTIQLQTACSE